MKGIKSKPSDLTLSIERKLTEGKDDEELALMMDALIVVYGKRKVYKWLPSFRDRIRQSEARQTQCGGG